MKKFIKGILLVIGIFILPINGHAVEISWEEIQNEVKNYYDGMTCTGSCPKFTTNDTSITISYFSENYGVNLSSDIQYADNVISLNTRNFSELTDLEKVQYASIDTTFVNLLLKVICKLENISENTLNSNIYNDLGIIYESEKVSYTNTTNNEVKDETFVKKFSIDLTQLEKGIEKLGLRGETVIAVEPSVDLKVDSKSNTTVSLILNVSSLSLKGETAKATCGIYSKNGNEEKLLATINCEDGKNTYTIPNLSAKTTYSFYVKLNYQYTNTNGQNISDNVVSETLEVITEDNPLDSTNPKTGESFVYICLFILIVSCSCIFLVYKKNNQQNAI